MNRRAAGEGWDPVAVLVQAVVLVQEVEWVRAGALDLEVVSGRVAASVREEGLDPVAASAREVVWVRVRELALVQGADSAVLGYSSNPPGSCNLHNCIPRHLQCIHLH